MGLFTGKRGIVMGVANERSIAAGIAAALAREGATLGFNHFPDKGDRPKIETRVRKTIETCSPKFLLPCDVSSEESISSFFKKAREHLGSVDLLVHSIAFAPPEDIICPTLEVSRKGFQIAMDISVYSLIAVVREALPFMNSGSSILTLTYFGGEKVVSGYNLMGVCKAALEAVVRYLAFDLGPKNIRLNAISAGALETLSSSAIVSLSKEIGSFSEVLKLGEGVSPLGRNVTLTEIANTALYLLGEMSTATTGEIIHVDCGYNIMGSPGHALRRLGIVSEQR